MSTKMLNTKYDQYAYPILRIEIRFLFLWQGYKSFSTSHLQDKRYYYSI